jgi:catechol 2,3-dioxygenase-like lactoylglutathione lyase family enzyme
MAKLKHIVFNTTDPERLARYYADVFGMEIVYKSSKGGFSLSDGYMNLSIHNNKMDGKPSGFSHIGFEVDDNDPYIQRCDELDYPVPEKRPADRHYTEYQGMDPDGNNIDLSTNGYNEIRPDREAPVGEVIPPQENKKVEKEKV